MYPANTVFVISNTILEPDPISLWINSVPVSKNKTTQLPMINYATSKANDRPVSGKIWREREGYLLFELPLPGQLSVPADQLHPLSGRQTEAHVVELVARRTQLESGAVTEGPGGGGVGWRGGEIQGLKQTGGWGGNQRICCANA